MCVYVWVKERERERWIDSLCWCVYYCALKTVFWWGCNCLCGFCHAVDETLDSSLWQHRRLQLAHVLVLSLQSKTWDRVEGGRALREKVTSEKERFYEGTEEEKVSMWTSNQRVTTCQTTWGRMFQCWATYDNIQEINAMCFCNNTRCSEN